MRKKRQRGAERARARREAAAKAARRQRTVQRILVIVAATILALSVGLIWAISTRWDAFVGAQWRYKWALLGLLLVPAVFWRTTFGEDSRTPRLKLGTIDGFRKGPTGARVWLRDVPGALRAVALGLMVLSLARPLSPLAQADRQEEGIDLVVVMDMSRSMNAVMDNLPASLGHLVDRKQRGVRPTRLDAAKAVIRDFISRRKTDRIGVVVFGKSAYVLSPPTLDYRLLDQLVSKMAIDLIDGGSTAIGDAVGVAVARLRRSSARSKAVILLTDGDNRSGKISPEYAAHLATVVGAKVFTIQIGDGGSAQIQAGFDLLGNPRYENVDFPVNPELLRKIATDTGGEAYVASDAQALRASFHSVLDKLEKTQFESSIARYEELYRYLLLPAVLLIALEALLRALLLRRFP